MKQVNNSLLLLTCFLSIAFLSSCFKEEEPILKKDRGPMVIDQVEMGNTYETSVYYSIMNKKQSAAINKYIWDLAFAGDSNNAHILVNTGKAMCAYKTDKTQLSEVSDTAAYTSKKEIDYPSGFTDSLALSGCLENKLVYILDLGTDAGLQKTGFKLILIQRVAGGYSIEYSNLNQSEKNKSFIPFNSSVNYIHFEFNGGVLQEEPASKDWEIVFAQYQHVYYNPFQTYSVVGCLINTTRVRAGVYTGSKDFAAVQASDTVSSNISSKKDCIGFGWKYYDLNKNQYIIRPEKTYFIKVNTGEIYKLHFTGFYNSMGVKGTPNFEFLEL